MTDADISAWAAGVSQPKVTEAIESVLRGAARRGTVFGLLIGLAVDALLFAVTLVILWAMKGWN